MSARPALRVRLALGLAALWWGGITALALVAVPVLFARLGSPAVAGPVAATLFSIVYALTMASTLVLLVMAIQHRKAWNVSFTSPALVLLCLGGLAAATQEGWVAHQIVTARSTGGDLKLWHSIGSALVLVQWMAAGVFFGWLTGRPVQTDR